MFQPCLLPLAAPHWSEGCHNQGESSAMGQRNDSDPELHLSAARAAIAGSYTGSTLWEVPISDGTWTATARTLIHTKRSHWPCKRASDEKGLPFLELRLEAYWRQPGPLSVASPHQPMHCHGPRACTGFSVAPLWVKGAGAGRGESTNLKGTELAQTQTSGLLLQQLGIRPLPQ